MLALTSNLIPRERMYDIASSVLQQKLSQIQGVGQVFVGGGALPAVRVDVNPAVLNAQGLAMEDIRLTVAAANVNRPKGDISSNATSLVHLHHRPADEGRGLSAAHREVHRTAMRCGSRTSPR